MPRELDNKAASSDSHQGQPSVSAAVGSDLDSLVSGTSPRNDQPIHSEPAVEIDDNDDEEMEALRELALKSMERPKTKVRPFFNLQHRRFNSFSKITLSLRLWPIMDLLHRCYRHRTECRQKNST